MGIKLVNGIETPLTAEEKAEIVEKNSNANLLKIRNENIIDKRINEYPSIGDVIDAIFKKEAGDSSEFDALATSRQEIKTKYPKESE